LVRREVNIRATLGGSIVRRMPVCICDISGVGCRISARWRLNPGDVLTLSVPSFGPFGGTVIWTEGYCIGFEFNQPLHPAVVRTITGMSKPRTPANTRPHGLAGWRDRSRR
jgi:hypothetical protein